ncbi:MAG: tetratricopeptide repeat protein [Gammaproteobacteria bacterium]|nr:tetratricopeptide repeat protein [Gammaproteobacteria bacterium]MYD75345.1 tetratricopeptide repeat protein [Gammaproteobacteria bacterium]MYJ51896.1 tetratricopeptide repeat protein [Gammaproteobacteria bacterium]
MTPYIVILFLLAVPIVAVMPALLNRTRIVTGDRVADNTRIALERIKEVRNVDDKDRLEAEDEIKNSLLEDAQTGGAVASRIIPIRHSLWIPVFLIGTSIGLYAGIGDPARLLGSSDSIQEPGLSQSSGDVADMIRQLEERIEANPNNVEALEIAGQVYATLGDYGKAEMTYRRLNDLVPGNPDYLTGLANAVILTNGDTYTEEAESFIRQALSIDPRHQNALWISALGASSRGQVEQAIRQLETLLTLVGDEESVRQSLLTVIEQHKSMLNDAGIGENGATGRSVAVEVSLAPGLSGAVSGTDAVFIVARAVNGPPAPLAVRKIEVSDLPRTVVLTRAHSMVEGMNIDVFDEIVVQARVSLTGVAQTNPGDLVSESVPVSGQPETALSLLIDTVLE